MVFNPLHSYAGSLAFSVPCGQCIGCRIARASDWATRMHHEASLHDDNAFITLTYRDEALPSDGSLSKREVQLFVKRMRKSLAAPISYFAVGEYGGRLGRPHYHLIVFGHGFPDRQLWRKSPAGHPLFRSEALEKLWTFGNCEVGEVTHQSAGYVARYCLKKVTGERAENYQRPHPVTGEFFKVVPEFALMSTKPAIGARWFEKWASDCFPSDFVIIDGRKRPVPHYYKKRISELEQLRVTAARKKSARSRAADSTPERLAVREELQELRAERLKRDTEQE